LGLEAENGLNGSTSPHSQWWGNQMAQSPISRPSASDPPEPSAVQPGLEEGQEAGVFLSYLAATLSSHGGGALSADLALDLVLNEIVEQTRLATNATGSAIALAREGEIICRATTGTNAPDLGVRLDAHSGLSGACVRTRKWQRCDDTEADSRVDAALCRRLGVRSILVFPVLKGEELLGVVEIFSSRPKAFSDRDSQTLQALSRNIVDNIERAAEVLAVPTPAKPSPSPEQSPKPPHSERPGPVVNPSPDISPSPAKEDSKSQPAGEDFKTQRPDYGTAVLTVIVIAVALLLGWMVGRTGRQRTIGAVKANPAVSSVPPVSPAPQAQPTILTATTAPVSPEPGDSQPPATASKKSERERTPSDGLVVYEKGKVVFRVPPSPLPTQSANAEASETSAQPQGQGSSENTANRPQLVSPEVANEYLTLRVEPEYPEQAREQHIQGPVILEVLVGKDGAVQKLKSVSGDPQLAAAATDAVRQWRFKPYYRKGRAEEFQTRVTVSFRLP